MLQVKIVVGYIG